MSKVPNLHQFNDDLCWRVEIERLLCYLTAAAYFRQGNIHQQFIYCIILYFLFKRICGLFKNSSFTCMSHLHTEDLLRKSVRLRSTCEKNYSVKTFIENLLYSKNCNLACDLFVDDFDVLLHFFFNIYHFGASVQSKLYCQSHILNSWLKLVSLAQTCGILFPFSSHIWNTWQSYSISA